MAGRGHWTQGLILKRIWDTTMCQYVLALHQAILFLLLKTRKNSCMFARACIILSRTFLKKEKMANMLKRDSVVLPPYSVFVRHGYLQHAGGEYVRFHDMRYHNYILLDDVNLMDLVAFGYGRSSNVEKKGGEASCCRYLCE